MEYEEKMQNEKFKNCKTESTTIKEVCLRYVYCIIKRQN